MRRLVEMLRNRSLQGLAVALVVLGGAYVGLAIFLAGHVAANVRVDGIAVGGMSSREATVTLERVLAGRVLRPVHLTCLLYTSDAADDLLCVDLGGRRLIKK